MLFASFVSMFCAVAAGIALAARRRDHRLFATLLGALAVWNLLGLYIDARFGLATRRPSDPPLTGWARLAFHDDEALQLASPAMLATLAIWHFAPRRALVALVAIAWAGSVAALAFTYPAVRDDVLRRVYLGAELGALFVGALSVASFWYRRAEVTPAHACTILLLFGDLATLLGGAWTRGIFGDGYALAQAGLMVLYASLALYQGDKLWTSSSPS